GRADRRFLQRAPPRGLEAHFAVAARSLKDSGDVIADPGEEVGYFAIDVAGGVLEIADRVLSRACDLVGRAAPLQLGIAGRLADGLLDRALHLFRRPLDLIRRALRARAPGKQGNADYRSPDENHWVVHIISSVRSCCPASSLSTPTTAMRAPARRRRRRGSLLDHLPHGILHAADGIL